jgi:TRAP transporter TAXI family solute receptor
MAAEATPEGLGAPFPPAWFRRYPRCGNYAFLSSRYLIMAVDRRFRRVSSLATTGLLLTIASLLLTAVGCDTSGGGSAAGGGRKFLSMGTAPVGGTFPVVGGAIAEVLNEHKGDNDWKVQAKGTKGSQENIRRLDQGELELALSNAAITYFAVRGESGWDQPYNMRSIVTLAPNVALFITRADSGIQKISDLKGKRVIIGPAGAGFEMFVKPLLEEHGVNWEEINALNATQSGAVDMLGDGAADAAFLGGAVPASSITQAVSTFDALFVPYDEEVRLRLIEKYPFFQDFTLPAGTYKGQDEEMKVLNVGSMHLITSDKQDEEQIYQITKTIWENQDEIAAKHPAGKAIRKNGTRYVGTAIRFYKEKQVWPEGDASASASPAKPASPDQPGAAGAGSGESPDPSADLNGPATSGDEAKPEQ